MRALINRTTPGRWHLGLHIWQCRTRLNRFLICQKVGYLKTARAEACVFWLIPPFRCPYSVCTGEHGQGLMEIPGYVYWHPMHCHRHGRV